MKTEYKVVWGRSADALTTIVMTNAERGWTPIGGVAVRDYGQCYQAMTKTKLMPVKTGGRTWLPYRQQKESQDERDESAHRLKWVRERLLEIEWRDTGTCVTCDACSTVHNKRHPYDPTHAPGCWFKAEIDELEK